MRYHSASLLLAIQELLTVASTARDDFVPDSALVSLQGRQEDTERLRQGQAGQAHVRLPTNLNNTLYTATSLPLSLFDADVGCCSFAGGVLCMTRWCFCSEKTPTALFFKYNTQLGPPYQVLVDTNFINFSIKNKVGPLS